MTMSACEAVSSGGRIDSSLETWWLVGVDARVRVDIDRPKP